MADSTMHSSSGHGGGREPLKDETARRTTEKAAREAAEHRSAGVRKRGSYKNLRWAGLLPRDFEMGSSSGGRRRTQSEPSDDVKDENQLPQLPPIPADRCRITDGNLIDTYSL